MLLRIWSGQPAYPRSTGHQQRIPCLILALLAPGHAATGQIKETMVPTYRAPVDEVMFLLTDVLKVARYDNLPGFADATPDLVVAILGEAAKLPEGVTHPLNRRADREGFGRHDDGRVSTPKGFKEAYRQYAEGGWMGLSAPTELGGQGLPETLTVIVNEMMASANMA